MEKLQASQEPLLHDSELSVELKEESLCPEKSSIDKPKLFARFGRRRTHNEQLLVHPCEVILSRATFYGSEAINAVKVFI